MNIKQIVELNNQFYQSVSKDFSKSRQKPWEGWGRAVEKIQEYFDFEKSDLKKTLKVLDIGCGNGRFFSYIEDKLPNVRYTGVDINNDLLNDAKKIYTNGKNNSAKFVKKDVIKNLDSIKGSFHVVVGFGITHHIPDKDFRKKWFDSIINLANFKPSKISVAGKKPEERGGHKNIVVLTFWDFEEKPGDYLVSWDNKIDTPRYCHKYSDSEIKSIEEQFKDKGFHLLDKYTADNKNLYLIFGKI